MQRFRILHRTYYNYSGPVTLAPHRLLLRPREDHELRIESFSMKISPEATLKWYRDVEGNSVAVATFNSLANQLAIASEAVIQQYNETPLDFLVADYAVRFPFLYLPGDQFLLSPYRALPAPGTMATLNAWISSFWHSDEEIQTYTLLQRLGSHIFRTLTYRVREEPGVQTPEETLSRGTGSCRDFANLFLEAARCLGLASRFASGYLHAPLLGGNAGATHAWAEVYLPGAGWKGFDPTTGEIVGSDHITVAVARLPESVPPVAGSFFGASNSSLDVGVWVSRC